MSGTVLAVETSCDETAVAVLRGFGGVAGHRIASQADVHAAFGGVVPEIASRSHLEVLPDLVQGVLETAGLDTGGVDAFAATTGPGLAAALMVGASAAKGLSIGTGKPFIAVNHIEGHLLSPFFGEEVVPPHVGLVVSGGHTLIFDVEGFGRYRVIGRTRDDAAGEAFDKVAKLLGLGYPGGARIDALARQGDATRFSFPRSMRDSGDLDFSFSGLKTAVRYFLEKGFSEADLPDICASFQQAVVDVLTAKAIAAAGQAGRTLVAVSGGVSSNSRLKQSMDAACADNGLRTRYATGELRADNALMIAYVAAHRLQRGLFSPLTADVFPNFNEALPGMAVLQ